MSDRDEVDPTVAEYSRFSLVMVKGAQLLEKLKFIIIFQNYFIYFFYLFYFDLIYFFFMKTVFFVMLYNTYFSS